jgi:hypothetical protein
MSDTEDQNTNAVDNSNRNFHQIATSFSDLRCHVNKNGANGLIEIVMYRQTQRWVNLKKTSQFLTASAIEPLRRIPYLDWLIEQAKAARKGDKSDGDPMITMFQEGLDEILSYSRHAMMLGPIAAAVLARNQIERWASSIHFSMGTKTASETPSPAEVAEAFNQTGFNMQDAWKMLSDLLHGHHGMIDLTTWESEECAKYDERWLFLSAFFGYISLSLRYVLLWIEQGLTLYIQDDLGCGNLVPENRPVDILPRLDTLHTGEHYGLLFQLDTLTLPLLQGAIVIPYQYAYRLRQQTGWPPSSGGADLLMLAFASRRGRAVHRAIAALDAEREREKELFSDQYLMAKEMRKAVVCETAGLIALNSKNQGSRYLAHVASSLRSAFVLWLEDDSQSMACIRVALEGVAKARAWRLKMDQAKKLDAWAAPVGRWLDLAGYRRLKPLYRRVNRFSHFVLADETEKIKGLADFLDDQATLSSHIQTTRGRIRQYVEFIVAIEIDEWLNSELPELSIPFWSALGINDTRRLRLAIEHWMNHVWSQREKN